MNGQWKVDMSRRVQLAINILYGQLTINWVHVTTMAIPSLDLCMAYQATVLLWPIGHIHHQWPIWPRHHLMDHLWPFVFWGLMALHLNPEAIAAIYSQMGISGHFPQNQGKWPKWLFLAIWAHNAHLRTLTQSVQKTLSRPLGQFLAQNPKVAKTPKGPRNTFSSSEAIPSIFFPSVFPSQDLWT
ncbi:hypothetical protein O181_028014 [Austropuccinia psidii MF-1]|uniref:Uncharacterized protein n=1 Tax=Austropuccinia psidii MF-1 TaxID=1389203 RepID=A0A9Q3CPY2_9BASI|nr:hypothetical protein [Austropuccinia psidii MF-1]